jgi:hypothetical protein
VLPYQGNGHRPGRAEVLAGIDRLLALNPALDAYAILKKNIEGDAGWQI